ncbi:hypothetical protein BDQ12DRAFT_614499, partial [Crucibulum laeve]
ENMAEAVWETLIMYGIQNKILAFMLDNASNNDTLVEGIEKRSTENGIPFNAVWARLRCMPHTVHLAAIQLLEAIGAVSKSESNKATSHSGNYQDSATASLDHTADNEATALGGEDKQEDPLLLPDTTGNILPAVDKVCLRKIVCTIRSSPQRKRSWLNQVNSSLMQHQADCSDQRALMLILDVKTHWSSTHQMMRVSTMIKFT